jgi:hypothetical protein
MLLLHANATTRIPTETEEPPAEPIEKLVASFSLSAE